MRKNILAFLLILFMSTLVYTVHAQEPIVENGANVTVETIEVPEGTITVTMVESNTLTSSGFGVGLLSETYFTDDLNQTCNNGAEFEFTLSGGPGDVFWELNWSSGSHSNTPYCSSSSCHYIIDTDWSAYYTFAYAQVDNPQTLTGPGDAYRCK